MEKFVKSHQVNLFLAGLGHLEPPLSKKGRKIKRLHRSDKELLRGLKKQTLKSDNPSRLKDTRNSTDEDTFVISFELPTTIIITSYDF